MKTMTENNISADALPGVRCALELDGLIEADGFGGTTFGSLPPPSGRYPAAYSVNFRRGPDGGLVKRCGTRVAFESAGDIRALCLGAASALPGDRWYYVSRRTLWRADMNGGGTAAIGDIGSDSGDISVFPFGGKMYVISAGGFYVTDGLTLSEASGYAPVVTAAVSGDGQKTECERENILTRELVDRFALETQANAFYLSRDAAVSTGISVTVDGVPSSGWTLIRVSPRMYVAPPSAVAAGHTVDIRYTAAGGASPMKAELLSCRRAAVWGGKNDESLILWGDSGVFFVSECEGGISPSAVYFTPSGRVEVGSGEPPTAFVHHGSNSMVFTRSSCRMLSQRTARRGRAAGGCGYLERSWSMSALSGAAGALNAGSAAEVGSSVFSADAAGAWVWKAGYIAGERNAEMIGSPDTVPSLTRELLQNCAAVRDRERGELWLVSPSGDAAVWNAPMRIWYGMKIPAFDRIYDSPAGPVPVKGGRAMVFDPVCVADAGDEPVFAAFWGVWSDCGWGSGKKTARLLTADLGAYTDPCSVTVEAVGASGELRSCSAELSNGTPLPKRAECALALGGAVYLRVCVESESGACRIDRLAVKGTVSAKPPAAMSGRRRGAPKRTRRNRR